MNYPAVVLLSTDGNLKSIHVFYSEDEYNTFAEQVLDGYDDGRDSSKVLNWSEFGYLSPYIQMRICEAVTAKLKSLGFEVKQ